MASLFTARRKPKRIVRDEAANEPDDDGEEGTCNFQMRNHIDELLRMTTLSDIFCCLYSVIFSADDESVESGPVVRRPTTNAPKTKSKLRVSFNPGEEEDGPGGGNTPQAKSSRLGLSSAAQDLINRTSTREQEGGEDQNHDRPKYNKAYLDELRHSTPSTPRDLSSRDSPSRELVDQSSNTALDLESKFGKAAISGNSSSRIPSAAEILEKKERRARLAKEQAALASEHLPGSNSEDFISLEDYDSDGEFKPRRMQVGSYIPPSSREKDTRLLPDDEDLAEGFDQFVEDAGRVTLSRKGQREQTIQEREAIRNLIDRAEGGGGGGDNYEDDNASGTSDSDSELERRNRYDAAQTHRGMEGLREAHEAHTRHANRPRPPRETTAIPKLAAGLTRLRDLVSNLEYERARIEKRRADIARERADIVASQAHIQTSLEEAGRELERVTREHADRSGTGTAAAGSAVDGMAALNGNGQPQAARGLESFGNTPENTS